MKKFELYKFLKERDGLICRLCGGSLEEEYHALEDWNIKRDIQLPKGVRGKRKTININIDHIVPQSLWKRGDEKRHEISNLQMTHKSCNTRKGNLYEEPVDYQQMTIFDAIDEASSVVQ